MIGKRIVQTQLTRQPLGQRLEAAAQHSQFQPEALQGAAKLPCAGGDGDPGLQLLENVCWDALEELDTGLE